MSIIDKDRVSESLGTETVYLASKEYLKIEQIDRKESFVGVSIVETKDFRLTLLENRWVSTKEDRISLLGLFNDYEAKIYRFYELLCR